MRLFIAICFSDETRAQLLAFQSKLHNYSASGNFSSPENLHLTLAFLGECDARQIISAKQAVNAIKFEPFALKIGGGGYLDKGRPNLVFCGIQNDDGYARLLTLQSNLSSTLSVKGFKLEKRKFWPHITLGREVIWKDIGDSLGFPSRKEQVASITLMRSGRVNGKLTYTPTISTRAQSGEPVFGT